MNERQEEEPAFQQSEEKVIAAAAQLRSALVEAIDGSLQVCGHAPSAYPQPAHTSTHVYLTPHLSRCRTSSPSSTAPSPPPAAAA